MRVAVGSSVGVGEGVFVGTGVYVGTAVGVAVGNGVCVGNGVYVGYGVYVGNGAAVGGEAVLSGSPQAMANAIIKIAARPTAYFKKPPRGQVARLPTPLPSRVGSFGGEQRPL